MAGFSSFWLECSQREISIDGVWIVDYVEGVLSVRRPDAAKAAYEMRIGESMRPGLPAGG